MNKIFEITVHVMGDVSPKVVQVFFSKKDQEYELGLNYEPGLNLQKENPRVKFNNKGDIYQTAGTPLDSNTLRDISEQIKEFMDDWINKKSYDISRRKNYGNGLGKGEKQKKNDAHYQCRTSQQP